MKKILFSLIAICITSTVFAQDNTFVQTSDSDKASNAILNEMKANYNAYKSIEADFTLTIEIPEQDPEVQEGTISQQGDCLLYTSDAADE